MLGEPDQNLEIKEEKKEIKEEKVVSSYEEEIKANEKIHIQDKRFFSKEDTSEIIQQVYIKEEELSDDEDRNVNALCDVDCDIESSNNNRNPMKIEHPADANAGLPLAVYIKEEHEVDKGDQDCDGVGPEEMFSNRANEEETFGNHFLSNFEDPLGVQGQSEKESTDLATGNGYMEYQMKDKGALPNESQVNLFEKLENGLMKCTKCKYTTSLLNKFNHHMQYSCGRPDIQRCTFCSYTCKLKSQLSKHVIAKHGSSNAVAQCPHCSFTSLKSLEVQNHIEKKHNKPNKCFNCEQCDYTTQYKSQFKYHIAASHTLKKNFACASCDYKCITARSMKIHMFTRHNKKITINECKRDYSFTN